jgi:hypothetical protein
MAKKALDAAQRGLGAAWGALTGCLCAPFSSIDSDFDVFEPPSDRSKRRYQRHRRSYFRPESPTASAQLAAAARPTKNPFADEGGAEAWEWPLRGHNERLARAGSAPLHVETVVPQSLSDDMPTPFQDWKPPFF